MAANTAAPPQARFEIVGPQDAPDWDAYVLSHPKGTVFHSSAMVRAFAAAKGHQPLAIAARDSEGDLAALLVAVRVNTLGGPASRFASRSIFYAEPFCRDDEVGAAALSQLLRAHDRRMSGVLFAEVRPINAPGRERAVLVSHGYPWLDYLNYVVDLRADEHILHTNLHKSLRKQLKRNAERGVDVELADPIGGVEQMYGHLELSYARSGVPLADISLFEAVLAELPSNAVSVRTVRHQGQPVASSICLFFKDRMYGWYGGSQRISGVSPDDSITWHEMLTARSWGATCYDFGGAGWPDEEYGPRSFKAKFGGELVNFGRYRKVFGPLRMKLATAAYAATRRFVAPSVKVNDTGK
ncbi:MAG: GNAT family N-acetyltransferase [Planctomycetales bacterium]|nr:GNAT family N-acetyltransferase [Planctomycetales bacterium]